MHTIKIKSVTAKEAFSDSGFPAVEVVVTAENGKYGLSNNIESPSLSTYRPLYLYDNEKRFKGFGVTKAADIINKYIAPALIGMPIDNQAAIDAQIKQTLADCGIPSYINISSPPSVAALKAAASAKNMPLFRYLGGQRAFTLPVGGHLCASGSKRYIKNEKAQGKPIYYLMAYDFPSFEEAHYALWETVNIYEKVLAKEYGILIHRGFSMAIGKGKMESDEMLWKILADSIDRAGHSGKIGIHADIGANSYYCKDSGVYLGLFCSRPKTRKDMLQLYQKMSAEYPFVAFQDPLEENDADGFAQLRNSNKAMIIGEELFASDIERIKWCISYGCVDSVLVSVNSFPTFSDALKIINYAKDNSVSLMFKDACGESLDTIAYAVGLNAALIYESGLDFSSNELLLREAEIGGRAKFFGCSAFKKNL